MDTQHLRRVVILLVVYGVIFIAVRLIVGPAEHVLGNIITGTLDYNLGTLSDGLVVNIVLLPLWIAAARNYKFLPRTLQYLAWMAMAYGAAIFVGAAWDEASRLVLPIMPFVFLMIFYKVERT